MPSDYFTEGFERLEARHTIESIELHSRAASPPPTASERLLRERDRGPRNLRERHPPAVLA
jgi:hypothetical protein